MRRCSLFRRLVLAGLSFSFIISLSAQVTFPVNGIADPRQGYYAFKNATIVKEGATILNNATLIIKDGKIVSVAANGVAAAGAVEIDCKGKYIYPSFIDIYTDYGITAPSVASTGSLQQPQIESNQKGAYGWNEAIKSHVNAYSVFKVDVTKAKSFREAGFGAVLSHAKDGIARGTGTIVALSDGKENIAMIRERASAHYSFSKGSSRQAYPSSMMGMIALLRQTYLDAKWYKTKPAKEGINLSLQAWNDNQALPQIFEANDKWNDLRADRIGDEFGVQYIIKGGGNEYQRLKEMKATQAVFILSLNFPLAMDVEDPNDARFVSLSDMKHWEMAPSNAAAMEKAGIPFCLSTADLQSVNQFWPALRKSMEYGLSEVRAMEALTKVPAMTLGIYDKVGSIEAGKIANFLITNGPLFNDKTVILENWVQGVKYEVKNDASKVMGIYDVVVNNPAGTEKYTLDVKSLTAATLFAKDTLNTKFAYDGKSIQLRYAPKGKGRSTELPASAVRLSGAINGKEWNGTGIDSLGNSFTWTAVFVKETQLQPDTTKKKEAPVIGKVIYPFEPYGWEEGEQPVQQTLLIKNGTVWTNEKEGILPNTDVLLKGGKIAAIGKGLSDPSAKVIDATGKYVAPGIIDEHSHIAAASINEGGQSVTSEVRIADNLNPDDINIYRQLAGGVTTSHILHGSANVIGGQTQLIKLRWGANDDELKFKGADGFIKFALGENVKRSNFTTQGNNNRYPDTRMGVEQVLIDAFTRAKDYQKAWAEYAAEKDKLVKAKQSLAGLTEPRRDLELDALSEILNEKRFITCHSYVQSEITGSIEVANKMGYKYNTFTHILEGYKVADKMKAHGANASTFSDWWAYKVEVQDAIAYNAAIMHRVGLNVAINSDDAEMARRLNQEAAKVIKYGGLSEEEAFKMVTLNAAKMLHVDDKVGSLKTGKDADVVIWSDNPLSIYAKAMYTIVDGTIYFDRAKDEQKQKWVDTERNRIVRKMNSEKKSGAAVTPAQPSYKQIQSCMDHHYHGLLDWEDEEGQ